VDDPRARQGRSRRLSLVDQETVDNETEFIFAPAGMITVLRSRGICTLVNARPHRPKDWPGALNLIPGMAASCAPEGFVNLIGNIAPGLADVVEILL